MRRYIIANGPSRVLEVGGGTGMLRNTLSRSADLYVCTDIAATGSTDLVCDGQALPFEDDSFDLVVAFEVLEHIPDTDSFLAECSRVLTPDGTLALSVPFMYGVHDFVDFYRFTLQGLARKLQEHGLTIREQAPISGTFTTLVVLFTNWVRQLVIRERSGWRAGAQRERAAVLLGAIVTAPMTPLVWLAVGLDRVLDSRSASPIGYFVTAARQSGPSPSPG
jgi:SAM-dependent methyltransferase